MAAPNDSNILNVTGRWIPNRALSDPLDGCFALQGIPWTVRKVINFATLELQYVQETRTEDSAPFSFTFKQTVRPGGFDQHNRYVIDSQKRTDTVPIFGEIAMHARYLEHGEVTQEQTLGNEIDHDDGGRHAALLEVVESAHMGWVASTVWAFETINGQRRFCKYNIVTKGSQRATAKMVYDYAGHSN
ncbi:hypothetical protein GGR56DRAFT_681980 [Xylariaceae sp. FL0804]|nr:hypothetical protein GGR56DRAFT_681980 [Xylariaceae sp. FL0804]